MSYEEWVRQCAPLRKLNSAYYHYRTNRWRWSPAFRLADERTQIDRPVFLLGTQGGGLTILSRILRRIPVVVSATGNCRYWAGYDEMQDVLFDYLPEDLRLNALAWPPRDEPLRDWLYAADDMLSGYHRTAADASPQLREALEKAIRGFVRMHAPRGLHATPRFLDKSQSFTVRISLIGALLRNRCPKFVLITRNPFAMCWRAVRKVASIVALEAPQEEKLALAAQHWANSMRTALHESEGLDLRWWRFEDFLHDPSRIVREICDFAELPFSPDILPGPTDRIPWGSMSDAFDRSKWYPLRTPANDSYLAEIPVWAIDVIAAECGDLLDTFRYLPSPQSELATERSAVPQ